MIMGLMGLPSLHTLKRAKQLGMLAVSAAVRLIQLGVVSLHDLSYRIISEDDILCTNTVNNAAIQELITLDNITKGVTAAVTTKANCWLINHSTGAGAMTGYALKVAGTLISEDRAQELKDIIHKIGHGANTPLILAATGIPDILDSAPFGVCVHI